MFTLLQFTNHKWTREANPSGHCRGRDGREQRNSDREENEELQQFLRTLFEGDLESGSESEAVSL